MARIDLFKWWKARAEKWPRLVSVARSMFACNAYVEDVTVQALETDEQTLWLNFCRENWSNVTRHNYDVSKQMLKIKKREEKKAAGEEESEEEESAPSSRSSSDPSSSSGSDSGSSVAARTGHTPNVTPSPPESISGSPAALGTTLLPGSPSSTADLNLHLSDQSDSTSPTPATSKTVTTRADSSNIPMSRTPSPTATSPTSMSPTATSPTATSSTSAEPEQGASAASALAISAEPGSTAATAEPEQGASAASASATSAAAHEPEPSLSDAAHEPEPGASAAALATSAPAISAEPGPTASATSASAISAEPGPTAATAEPEPPAVVRIEPGTGEPIRTARRQLFTMTEPPTHEDDPNEETYNYWELG